MMEKKCQFCDQVFHKNEHLDRHERTHTKDRPYKCSVCDKYFVRNDTLKRHERLHSRDGSPPFKRRAGSAHVPPSDHVGLFSVNTQRTTAASNTAATPLLPKLSPTTGNVAPDPHNVQYNTRYTTSPSFLSDQGQTMSPMSASENLPMSFDFDINALNQFLTSGDLDTFMQPPLITPGSEHFAPVRPYAYPKAPDSIKPAWFTNMDEKDIERETAMQRVDPFSSAASDMMDTLPSGKEVEMSSGSRTVDETWRERVSEIMIPQIFNIVGPLPSIEFLNMCFDLYFHKFHALYPMIHRPTFRINGINQFLVTAMSLIGALFVGTPASRIQAGKIFRQLNKVVLATWENAIVRKNGEDLVVVKTTIIGQLFALMSGNPVYMSIFFSFHGTVVAWARKTGFLTNFDSGENQLPNEDMGSEELDHVWQEWARVEQVKRSAMALYIQDSELAALYHAPPGLRHTGNRHYYACHKDVFEASDPDSWARAITAHPPLVYTIRQYFTAKAENPSIACLGRVPLNEPPQDASTDVPDPEDDFTLYVILLGIQAQVCEAREIDTLFSPNIQKEITILLMEWYKSYRHYRSLHSGDSPYCLMILWHSIFVSLFSNIQDLEIAFGSQGSDTAVDNAEEVTSWVSTPGAKRAALHVICIRALLSRLSLSIVPPIHIPRVTFQAAIVCWCYIRYKEMSPSPQAWDSFSSDWIEFSTAGLNVNEMQRELQKIRSGWGSDQPLSPFSEILQRLGHWGLSNKLGNILNVAIQEEIHMR